MRPRSGRPCRLYNWTMPSTYTDRKYVPPAPAKKPKPAPKPVARSGKAEPWSYGPFRVVAARRVSEEEQLSVESYHPTLSEARGALKEFLAEFRDHMIAYNERVVLVQQQHLEKIEQMIEARGIEARRLEAEIEQLVARKQDIAHPDAPDVNDNEADVDANEAS